MGRDEMLTDAVLKLAESCRYEKGHTHQVTKLTLRLFDELRSLHGLGDGERSLLQAGALLHDIGWINGGEAHHKTARDIILKSQELPLDENRKTIVALIARYHRGALPVERHKYYGELPIASREIVRACAALLRVADGLDRRHVSCVDDLTCEVLADAVVVHVKSRNFSEWEKDAALKKSDLFEDVFHKQLMVVYQGELTRKP